MDYGYIAEHIHRIENRFKNDSIRQQDSMWRIASNADLFPLTSDKLNNDQIEQVNAFIDRFKKSKNGAEAIEIHRKLKQRSRTM